MSRLLGFCLSIVILSTVVAADERRAPRPKFSEDQLRGIFFEKLDDAFRGQRPTLSSVRTTSQAAPVATTGGNGSNASESSGEDTWSPLISPTSIEDEVKRLRLHYDSIVTTPGAFNSGGYQDARLDLTALASLFAVINEHSGEVRWKDQAAVARDLIARTAFNCKAGSTQVYNEAKLRKADLQDLISGSGISGREAVPENNWALIADRGPLMEYAEQLIEALEEATRNQGSAKSEADMVRRTAELLAMLGEIFTQEGMDEADDDDYIQLSHGLSEASRALVEALDRNDWDTVTSGASEIRERCAACHDVYR